MRPTLNIIETAQKQNLPVGMTLDAEKAFDKVLWPHLFETLRNFGLHATFINWLKKAKGTRQGDALSPFIFAFCIEPLAECIRIEHYGDFNTTLPVCYNNQDDQTEFWHLLPPYISFLLTLKSHNIGS